MSFWKNIPSFDGVGFNYTDIMGWKSSSASHNTFVFDTLFWGVTANWLLCLQTHGPKLSALSLLCEMKRDSKQKVVTSLM